MDPARIRTPSPVSINYTEASELPGRSGESRLPDLNLEPSAFDLDSLLSLAQELVSKQDAPPSAGQTPSKEDRRSSICVFESPPALPRPAARECEPEGRRPGAGFQPPEEMELRCLLDQRTDAASSPSHLRLRCFVTGGGHPRSESGSQPACQGPPLPSAFSPQIPDSLRRDPAPSPAPSSFLQNFSRSCPRTPGSFLRDLAPSSSSPPDPSSLLQDLAPSYAAVSEMYRAAESIWDAEISVLSNADDYCPVSLPSREPSRSQPSFQSLRDDWTSRGLRDQLERASRLQSWGSFGPGPAYGPESSQDPKPDYDLGSSCDPGPSPESARPSSPDMGVRDRDSGSKRGIWTPPREDEAGGLPEPSRSPGAEQPDKGPPAGLSQIAISSLSSLNHSAIGVLGPNPNPDQSTGGLVTGQIQNIEDLVQEQIRSLGGFALGQSPGGSSHGHSAGGSSRKHSPRGSVQGRNADVSVNSTRNIPIQEQNPREFSRRNSPGDLVPEPILNPGDFPLGQSPAGSYHWQRLAGSLRKHSSKGSVQGRSPGVSTPVQSPRNIQMQAQNPEELSRKPSPAVLVPGQTQNPGVLVPEQNLSHRGSSLGQSPAASLHSQSLKESVQEQNPGGSSPVQSPSNVQVLEPSLANEREASRENIRGSSTSIQSLDDIEPFPLGKPDVAFLIRSEIDQPRRSAKSFSISSQQRGAVSPSGSFVRLSRQSADGENTGRGFKTREHVDPFILQPPDDSMG